MNELEKIAAPLKDKARLVKRKGSKVLVSHKFTPEGDVLDNQNVSNPKNFHQLNLSELKFLVLWDRNGYDEEKTASESGLSEYQTASMFKKLAHFKQEDAWIKAAVTRATPGFVISQDMKNVYGGGTLNDSQHKSLDRVAKCVGAFKTNDSGATINIFNLPKMTPETEAAIRAIADREADVVEGQLA